MVDDVPAGFTCPTCHRTSYHPTDVAEGYCGACHAWTGVVGSNHWSAHLPTPPDPDWLVGRLAEIADELTPGLQAELRSLGVAAADNYRLSYEVTPQPE